MNKTIMLVAGEASGDLHGAGLIQAMSEREPTLFFCGIGGDQMRRAGMRPITDADLAVMGVTDVLFHFPRIQKAYRLAVSVLDILKPDLLVLIDYPGFNLRLARAAKKRGISVLYYISPKVWAWRDSRVKHIAEYVDKLALILPFEEKWFRARGVFQAFYVGNPLMDHAQEFRELRPQEEVRREPVIGLMPGSRAGEIQRLLPVLCEAADQIARKIPGARFLLSASPGVSLTDMEAYAAGLGAPFRMDVVSGAHPVFQEADAVAAVSGTVTLEAALSGVPTVLVYRMSSLSFAIARKVVKIPYAGLANLIAEKEVMPELLQEEAQPETIASAICSLLLDEETRKRYHQGLREVRAALGEPGVAKRAAELAFSILGDKE